MRTILKSVLLAGALLASLILSTQSRAADPAAGFHWPEVPWHTNRLAKNVYWIDGGGGNSGILIGQHGVVVFDSKTNPDAGKELLRRIAKLTTKPVTTVILSHSDVDHVGGLPAFPKGVTIIAQRQALEELQQDLKVEPTHALPAQFFPTKTVGNKEDLTIDGIKMELLHWAPAHTGGDMVLYLPDQKILFTGDIATEHGSHPLIHLEKNGSSEGWIASMKGILTLDVDRYVPGHGTVMNRHDVQQALDDAEAERAKIKAMVTQGKSLPEIEAAVGDPTPAEKALPFPPFSEVIYRELTHKTP